MHRCLYPLIALALCTGWTAAQEPAHAELKTALQRAGENAVQLREALQKVPADQKRSMEFLISNMPPADLQQLSAEFLLENVALAWQARREVPWGAEIPEEIFLNDVLPYANVDERRDLWRRDFMERFLPVVADCKTPSEAAQRLNETVFKTLKVRYSTKRRRANQSPQECIESGLASCTGLSIVLVDACRAVGVPARLAGIPQWANKRGNHTWVEIWDKKWHFTGAAEPSRQGLNHTWFQGDAAQAVADSRLNAIYAVSFRKTDTTFPLVWAPDVSWVHAVNVTARYAPPKKTGNQARLMVRVWNSDRSVRVAADVAVHTQGSDKKPMAGRSRDETFDTNDLLSFPVLPDGRYEVRVTHADSTVAQSVRMEKRPEVIVDIVLPAVTSAAPKTASCEAPAPGSQAPVTPTGQ